MNLSYKTIILSVIILSMISTIGVLKYQNNKLEYQVNTLKDTETNLRSKISSQENDIDNWKTVYEEQTKYRDELNEELNQTLDQLNKYKNRQNIVYAKPTLVQKLEQKALDEFFNEVQNGK